MEGFEAEKKQKDWSSYHEQSMDRPVHMLTCRATEGLEPGPALDLGSGSGTDAQYLLEKGFAVTCVDASESSQRIVKERFGETVPFIRSKFEDLELKPESYRLVIANYALPFIEPEKFEETMHNILASVEPGGRFAATFFGPHDSWSSNPRMTFVSADQLRSFFTDFTVDLFKDRETDGLDADKNQKHWHIHYVLATKKTTPTQTAQ